MADHPVQVDDGGLPTIARNAVPERQNITEALTILAAARHNFDRAMNVATAELVLAVAAPVILTVIAVFVPEFTRTAAIYGLLLAVAEPVVFDHYRKRCQEVGARIQERFDCLVLDLPSHETLTGRGPDREDIHEAARAFRRKPGAEGRLRDWYSPAVGELPQGLARIACQRINCRWDAATRRRYRLFLVSTAIAATVLVIVWHALANRTTTQLVLSFAALSPVVRWAIAEWYRQDESLRTSDELKDRADALWQGALKNRISNTALAQQSRDLQDAIFLRRRATL